MVDFNTLPGGSRSEILNSLLLFDLVPVWAYKVVEYLYLQVANMKDQEVV